MVLARTPSARIRSAVTVERIAMGRLRSSEAEAAREDSEAGSAALLQSLGGDEI